MSLFFVKTERKSRNMLTAVVGINWGDEGKGRIVDLLSEDQDIVVRYQGGNNAGHTVINDKGEFILNLLPSGILRENVVCVMGNGMAIDLKHLHYEIQRLREKGIHVGPDNLKISDRAIVTMPYHVDLTAMRKSALERTVMAPRGVGLRRFTVISTRRKLYGWAICSTWNIFRKHCRTFLRTKI